jgi:ferredoxin--NADP+ reductase
MTYVITRSCCNDAVCTLVCPVDCIHPTPQEPDFREAEQLYIDPATCIDCNACAEACPVDAIYPEAELPPRHERFIALNALYYRGLGAQA